MNHLITSPQPLGKLTVICGEGLDDVAFNPFNCPTVFWLPETGTHPAKQRAFARKMANDVNKGSDCVLMTHSDYIVKELNTLIMLGNPGCQSIMEKYGYRQDELLNHADVKAYEIGVDGVVTEAGICSELGIEMKSFDRGIDEMNDIQEAIIFGSEGDY